MSPQETLQALFSLAIETGLDEREGNKRVLDFRARATALSQQLDSCLSLDVLVSDWLREAAEIPTNSKELDQDSVTRTRDKIGSFLHASRTDKFSSILTRGQHPSLPAIPRALDDFERKLEELNTTHTTNLKNQDWVGGWAQIRVRCADLIGAGQNVAREAQRGLKEISTELQALGAGGATTPTRRSSRTVFYVAVLAVAVLANFRPLLQTNTAGSTTSQDPAPRGLKVLCLRSLKGTASEGTKTHSNCFVQFIGTRGDALGDRGSFSVKTGDEPNSSKRYNVSLVQEPAEFDIPEGAVAFKVSLEGGPERVVVIGEGKAGNLNSLRSGDEKTLQIERLDYYFR